MTAANPGGGPVAGTLVVVFTPDVGLCDWERAGLLSREWRLYERVGACFDDVVLVTWGGAGDREFASRLTFAAGARAPRLRINAWDAAASRGPFEVVAKSVSEAVGDAPSTVVKTNQMSAGRMALAVAAELRRSNRLTALVARGGFPWSCFEAWEHGPDSPRAREACAAEAELCRGADMVVATTREMADDLASRHSVERSRLAVVPNYVCVEGVCVEGVCVEGVCVEGREREGCEGAGERDARNAEGHTVLFAGRLERQKRVDRLVDAMALLPPSLREVTTLSIIGEGSQAAALKAQAQALGVRLSMEPRMPHETLLSRMAMCSIYAQVSDFEGHPKTVLEAMAVGAPVLVGDAPGLGTVVEDGVTGVRVALRPEAIASGLQRLLADRGLAARLGRAAETHVREHCGLERIAALEISVYERALANAATSGSRGGDHAGRARLPRDERAEMLNRNPAARALG